MLVLTLSKKACRELLKCLLVLNLLDGIFTTIWLETGLAIEANPLMRVAYYIHPAVFMILKLFIVSSGVLFLSYQLDKAFIRLISMLFFVAYSMVLCYHLVGLMISFQY